MKILSTNILIVSLVLLVGCSQPESSQQASNPKMDAFINDLMLKMTLEEKIGQLNLPVAGGPATGIAVNKGLEDKIRAGQVGGIFGVWGPDKVRKVQEIAVNESRLKIPLFFGLDVIHGHKTIYPIPLGMAATWDMSLIERGAQLAAQEASAEGLNWTFSPMVDISRDPRWGRISEGSGEDPYLGSLIAQAMVRGYQGNDLAATNTIMACVKHFALYGAAEAGRDYNTVDMSRATMYNFFLPPYKAALDAGAASIMSSFNVVDGIPASGNKWLLTDVLRKQWGFKGFVVSDYTSINEMINHGMGDLKTVSSLALNAGMDMDMVGEGFLTTLKKSIEEKTVTEEQIDQACRRILEAKYKLGLFDDPYKYISEERAAKEVFNNDTRQVARQLAAHSFVLLKNKDQLLPLNKTKTMAFIGPLANNQRDMLGTWVIGGEWDKSVSVLEGVKNALGEKGKVLHAKGANITNDPEMIKRLNFFGQPNVVLDERSSQAMLQEAVATASRADIIVAVLGESQSMSGESSSRTQLDLPESQKELLKALVKTGKKVVLVLFTGRPLTLTWEDENVDAILNVWAPGHEAGNAIADVLFGNYNPSGKLPATFPRSVGQVPLYYNHLNTGRPWNGIDDTKFKSNYLDEANVPLYPFGFGLSYTTFGFSDITLSKQELKGNETLTATVTVTNTGNYEGEETVQLYIRDVVGSVSRPMKELKGFSKINLKPGESKQVSFEITPNDLKFYNYDLKYEWEPGDFEIMIGSNSRDVKMASINWKK
uniref:Periplasmic beta-glucosidase n=1 Tax=uncultured organism TaxID=155900 RepID=H9CTG4_9ZZZZ|nr:glucosidase [uncultured organism]